MGKKQRTAAIDKEVMEGVPMRGDAILRFGPQKEEDISEGELEERRRVAMEKVRGRLVSNSLDRPSPERSDEEPWDEELSHGDSGRRMPSSVSTSTLQELAVLNERREVDFINKKWKIDGEDDGRIPVSVLNLDRQDGLLRLPRDVLRRMWDMGSEEEQRLEHAKLEKLKLEDGAQEKSLAEYPDETRLDHWDEGGPTVVPTRNFDTGDQDGIQRRTIANSLTQAYQFKLMLLERKNESKQKRVLAQNSAHQEQTDKFRQRSHNAPQFSESTISSDSREYKEEAATKLNASPRFPILTSKTNYQNLVDHPDLSGEVTMKKRRFPALDQRALQIPTLAMSRKKARASDAMTKLEDFPALTDDRKANLFQVPSSYRTFHSTPREIASNVSSEQYNMKSLNTGGMEQATGRTTATDPTQAKLLYQLESSSDLRINTSSGQIQQITPAAMPQGKRVDSQPLTAQIIRSSVYPAVPLRQMQRLIQERALVMAARSPIALRLAQTLQRDSLSTWIEEVEAPRKRGMTDRFATNHQMGGFIRLTEVIGGGEDGGTDSGTDRRKAAEENRGEGSEKSSERFWSHDFWPDVPPRGGSSPSVKLHADALYEPLPYIDSIRVLRIEPGQIHDPIVCTLHLTQLHGDLLQYEALSYVWGNISDQVDILCNTRTLRVTRSLNDALLRLRFDSGARYVWADAIAINQQDIAERGHQVGLMRLIYQRAKRVLVYLGPDPGDHAIPAFSVICAIASVPLPGAKNSERATFTSNGVSSDETKNLPWETGSPSPDSSLWFSVARLYGLSWFWRLWCIQEVALASSAEIIWGGASVSWRWLGLASARIRTNNYQVQHRLKMTGVFNAYLVYRISQGQSDLQPLKVTFFRLLGLTRQFESSDQRDRVFGLLGIPTTDTNPDEGDLFMTPDYNMPLEEVYKKLAIKVRDVDDGLQILSSVQHGPKLRHDIVSWVPRWDDVYTHTLAPSDPDNHHHASGGRAMVYQNQDSPNTLKLTGIEVDSVSNILPTITTNRFLSTPSFRQMYRLHLKLQTEKHRQRLCLTLTAGKDWYGLLVDEAGASRLMVDFSAYITQYYPASSLPLEPTTFKPDQEQSAADIDRFIEAASNACNGRRLFFTYSGYIGLGPAAMREGDRLVVLFGGEMPYILRPEGRHFRFVGECYVHDLMKGQAVRKLKQRLVREASFELK